MFELPCEPPAVGGWNFMLFSRLQGESEDILINLVPIGGQGLMLYTPTHADHDSAIGCRAVALTGPILIGFEKEVPKRVECYVSTDDADGRHNRPVQLRAYDSRFHFLGSDTSRSSFGPSVDGAKFVNLQVNHGGGIAWCIMDPAAAESDKLILGTVTAE